LNSIICLKIFTERYLFWIRLIYERL